MCVKKTEGVIAFEAGNSFTAIRQLERRISTALAAGNDAEALRLGELLCKAEADAITAVFGEQHSYGGLGRWQFDHR